MNELIMTDSQDDKYFLQNGGSIKMAALGRRFQIGTLYDYRTDTTIEETLLWDPDEIGEWTGTLPIHKENNFVHILPGCRMENKFNHYCGMDEHLAASWVSGLIGPFHQGAASHLTDDLKSEFRPSAHLCVAVRTLSRYEKVDFYLAKSETDKSNRLDIVCHPSVWKEDGASHVVTAVSYGLDTHCAMELELGNPVDGFLMEREDAMDVLEEAANLLRNELLADDSDDLPDLEFPSSFEHIKVKLFADWNTGQLNPIRLSYREAFRLCCQNISSSSTSDRNKVAVPLTVWLRPLSDVIQLPFQLTRYRPISSGIVTECLRFYIRLNRIQSKIRQSTRHPFADRESLNQLDFHLSQFLKLFQRVVGQMVRSIRTSTDETLADGEETLLCEMIQTFAAKDSFLNPDLIDQWMDRHCRWLDIAGQIQRILPNVPVLFVGRKDLVTQTELEPTLIYRLPRPISEDDFLLEEMANYLDRNKKKRSNNLLISCKTTCRVDPDEETELEKWSRRVILTVRQFGQFISENAANTKEVHYQIRIEGDAEPEFKLFQNGVMERYALPTPPDGLRVLDNRRGAITLGWSVPLDGFSCQLTGFLIEYRSMEDEDDGNQNLRWTRIGSTDFNRRVQINNLVYGKEYYFQVATGTVAGRSKFSLPIGPIPVKSICRPPRNLIACSVTDNVIRLCWDDPLDLEHDLKITGYEVEYWPDDDDQLEQMPRTCVTQSKTAKLDHLIPGTTYNIRVAVVCGSTGSSPCGPTIQSKTMTEPERLALTVRKVCSISTSRANPSKDSSTKKMAVYDIPLRPAENFKKDEDQLAMKRLVFGYPNLKFQHKTILVVGATGAGKTTLINSMINYVLGVEWDDDFRFRMVVEPDTLSQAHSQTNVVTSYDLFHSKGSRLDYSLTIVDTPGFGDTRGLEQDNKIREQIRRYFSQVGGVQQLEAVCFVVQSSLPRLTPTQLYIFESILSVFGNDIKDNIRLMTTFADGQEPPVLAAIREARVPCPTDTNGVPLHYKFNNSSFFADKDGQDPNNVTMMDSFNRLFFSMSLNQFQSFFQKLHHMPTTSLSLTKEVLHERKRLEVVVEGLEQRIHVGLAKLEELNQMKKTLTEHQDKMAANQEFQFEVEYVVPKQTDISGTGYWISNCQKCQWTCHYPCESPNDKDRYKCFSMDNNGYCRICPGRCFYTEHFNQKFKWEQEVVKVQKSSEEVRQKYQTAQTQSVTVQDILDRMSQELVDFEKELMSLVDTAHPLIARLNEIALRPHPFSAPDYIDLIITAEQQEHRSGYLDRIETLKKLRLMAAITSKLIKKEKVFDSSHL